MSVHEARGAQKSSVLQMECHRTPQHAEVLRSHDWYSPDVFLWNCMRCNADMHKGGRRYMDCNTAGMADLNAKQEQPLTVLEHQ